MEFGAGLQYKMAHKQTDTPTPMTLVLENKQKMLENLTISYSFKAERPEGIQNPPKKPTIPAFNQDRKHFTPAFILPLDNNYYQLNQEFELQKFKDKTKNALHELSNPNLEVVSPSSTFCQICKEPYSHYSSHINQIAHHNKLQQSQAQLCIQQLCTILFSPTAGVKGKTAKAASSQSLKKQKRSKKKSKPINKRFSGKSKNQQSKSQRPPSQIKMENYNSLTNSTLVHR